MSQELLYTSAPQGLLPGSQGFTTVAATRGLPAAWREALEGLCGYRPLYPPNDPRNPIAYAHLRLAVAGGSRSVLARVGPAGLDYTGRPNKFAHLLILGPNERPAAGPAWLLTGTGLLEATWDGQVGWREVGRTVPHGDARPGVCEAWQRATGDAGWAGVLVEAFLQRPDRPAVLLFEPGMDLLPLMDEAIRLLPPARRWDVTFNTYGTGLPPTVACAWRGLVHGTPEAKAAVRLPGTFVLDLTQSLGPAVGGPLVEAARTGRVPSAIADSSESQFVAAGYIPLATPSAARTRTPTESEEGLDWPEPEPEPDPEPSAPRGDVLPSYSGAPVVSRTGRLVTWLLLLGLLGGISALTGVLIANRSPDTQPQVTDDSAQVEKSAIPIGENLPHASAKQKDKEPSLPSDPSPQVLKDRSITEKTSKLPQLLGNLAHGNYLTLVPSAIDYAARHGAFLKLADLGRTVSQLLVSRRPPPRLFAQHGLSRKNELVEISKHVDLPQGTDFTLRLLLHKPQSVVESDPKDQGKRILIRALILQRSVELDNPSRAKVPKDFAEFRVVGHNVTITVLYHGEGAEDAWRDLLDSVLVISFSGGSRFIALRVPQDGGVTPIRGTGKPPFAMNLQWGKYEGLMPRGPFLIRSGRLKWEEKTYDIGSAGNASNENKDLTIKVSRDGRQLEVSAPAYDQKAVVEALEIVQDVPGVPQPVVVFRLASGQGGSP